MIEELYIFLDYFPINLGINPLIFKFLPIIYLILKTLSLDSLPTIIQKLSFVITNYHLAFSLNFKWLINPNASYLFFCGNYQIETS